MQRLSQQQEAQQSPHWIASQQQIAFAQSPQKLGPRRLWT
jgi:hypothetical protein